MAADKNSNPGPLGAKQERNPFCYAEYAPQEVITLIGYHVKHVR